MKARVILASLTAMTLAACNADRESNEAVLSESELTATLIATPIATPTPLTVALIGLDATGLTFTTDTESGLTSRSEPSFFAKTFN